MQRISLARAIYMDKPILLLDEVTSSLDKDNAKLITDTVKGLKGKTVLWISHQNETLDWDWVNHRIHIKDGQISED